VCAGVKDPDVRRVTSEQPGQWYHAYQVSCLNLLFNSLDMTILDNAHKVFGS
jgi:hypothetical protein